MYPVSSGKKCRQGRPQSNAFDPQVQERQQRTNGLFLAPGDDQREDQIVYTYAESMNDIPILFLIKTDFFGLLGSMKPTLDPGCMIPNRMHDAMFQIGIIRLKS